MIPYNYTGKRSIEEMKVIHIQPDFAGFTLACAGDSTHKCAYVHNAVPILLPNGVTKMVA